MARTAVTVTELTANTSTDDPAGTALDAANDHVISGVPLEELVLEVTVTNAGGGDITIVAGDNPPALEAGQGNVAVTFAQNDVKFLGPFTSGRFIQAGAAAGDLHVDVAAGVTGTIKALHVPRTA